MSVVGRCAVNGREINEGTVVVVSGVFRRCRRRLGLVFGCVDDVARQVDGGRVDDGVFNIPLF